MQNIKSINELNKAIISLEQNKINTSKLIQFHSEPIYKSIASMMALKFVINKLISYKSESDKSIFSISTLPFFIAKNENYKNIISKLCSATIKKIIEQENEKKINLLNAIHKAILKRLIY